MQKSRAAWLLVQMLVFASSPKEKVAASAVRALGFFLAKVDFNYLDTDLLGAINAGSEGMPKLSDLNPQFLNDQKVLSYGRSV